MQAVTASPRSRESRKAREVYLPSKTHSFFETRSSTARPVSEATEIFDTDFETDSEFEEEASHKRSFDSEDSRRRSQTTISSYDEAPTPSSGRSQRQFEIRFKPVEGPKGPHLFRASQTSVELDFEYALQMSPMLPKEAPARTETAFSHDTVTPTSQQQQGSFSIDAALAETRCTDNYQEDYVRFWTTHQVVDWMVAKDIDAPIIDTFELNDISGAALMDLQFEHLKELDIQSLGKRLTLWNEICQLRGGEGALSPQPTPFQDVSRPCTAVPTSSPSRGRGANRSSDDGDATPISAPAGKKRRGRKPSKNRDIVTPAESVSIVAIEQLMPKPHKCDKGERCGKWRRQQREIKQLQDDHGLGTFPISPRKGGHVFVFGDPGNAGTAANIVPNVHKQQIDESGTLTSDVVPSLVASSDALGPGHLPEFALHEHYLDHLESRDPQDNVRQFLNFQHMQVPSDGPATPPEELAHPGSIGRSESVPLFPAQHYQAYPSLNPNLRSHTAAPRESHRPLQRESHKAVQRESHKDLPRLEIPRPPSAGPTVNAGRSANSCRTGSPADVYRFGTPASEMDIPLTAIPTGPVARDTSQSVPPNMQYRQQSPLSRSQSTRITPTSHRRPSATPLAAVKEHEVLPTSASARPSLSAHPSSDSASSATSSGKQSIPDPAHHVPNTQTFGYGSDCTHAGWMKKRRTKMLRHEWQDAHFRLKGTSLAMHDSARLSAVAKDTINVENYAVACSSVASTNKLSAAMKAFTIKHNNNSNGSPEKAGKAGGEHDPTAFAFQLVPSRDGDRRVAASGKTHHFSVKNKDQRIDWMREIMLAKALQQKGRGFDVEVNGVMR
ncbi:uncharacterized protein LTR77_002158 [Saxophila tyrrhenica]|uniref:Uncharacterized protein n=1 Tax=Saxophila tyrrhenica TaxID=1690608 RepID=A0AAV9PI54_9PEZI|nr:hypothetical protein LTR77_002158 [Saxophila tyrrhenica]